MRTIEGEYLVEVIVPVTIKLTTSDKCYTQRQVKSRVSVAARMRVDACGDWPVQTGTHVHRVFELPDGWDGEHVDETWIIG